MKAVLALSLIHIYMIPMVFFLVSILLVLLMWRSFRLLEKKYLAPFNNLIDTMAVIENGNMETRLENQSNISEFQDRKSTRLNSSHSGESRMPSSA